MKNANRYPHNVHKLCTTKSDQVLRALSAISKPTTEFAQPRLRRSNGGPVRGYKFGCVCSCVGLQIYQKRVLSIKLRFPPPSTPAGKKCQFSGFSADLYSFCSFCALFGGGGGQTKLCGQAFDGHPDFSEFRCVWSVSFRPTQMWLYKFGCGFGAPWPFERTEFFDKCRVGEFTLDKPHAGPTIHYGFVGFSKQKRPNSQGMHGVDKSVRGPHVNPPDAISRLIPGPKLRWPPGPHKWVEICEISVVNLPRQTWNLSTYNHVSPGGLQFLRWTLNSLSAKSSAKTVDRALTLQH